MAMQAALWFIFSATALKTLLVADAVWDATGRHGFVMRAVARVKGNGRTEREGHVTPVEGSFTKRGLPVAQVGRGSGRFRRKTMPKPVHVWLLSMHFLALLAQGAAVFEYLVPITDYMCLQTRRVMLSTFLLFDSALVLFLLAKTDVTNVNRAGATSRGALLWERVIKRCSYVWACVWMPVVAAVLTYLSCGGASSDGERCSAGMEHVHTEFRQPFVAIFLVGKFLLGVQLLVLLVLFLKPMLAPRGQGGHLSALQRRTVVRNIVCTIGVVVLHLIEGVIVYIVVFSDFDEDVAHAGHGGGGSDSGEDSHDSDSSLEGSEAEIVEHRGADAAQMIQTLLTLCLTEITITLGFTSTIKTCWSNTTRWPPAAPWTRKRKAALVPSGEMQEEAELGPSTSNGRDSEGGGRGTGDWK